MISLEQFSVKLMMAAAACDCTLWFSTSSMMDTSAGSTLAWYCSCKSGPRSVSSCPMALIAAQRTRGWGSRKRAMSWSMIVPRLSVICFLQPSATWEMQQRAACLYFQSGCSRKAGTRSWRNARLKTVLPPRERARRSRQSFPTSRLLRSVSSSSSVVAFHSARLTSSTTSISCSARGTMFCRKTCCLRIMAGACSAMVTRSSTARKRVSSSSCAAVTIWMAIWTRGSMWRRKNFGASSATEMNSSRDERAVSSSCSLSALVSTCTMCGIRSVRFCICGSMFESD
mmetsp:Transcript_3718/g.9356  ORF Transcript_3718/g.9356 Transcript_3718/m.9356 type:complete len:285 (-) Transcript_3718:663-1517(-)